MIAEEVELKKLWREASKLMVKHGANDPPNVEGVLAGVIDEAGGWALLCKLSSKAAREKFSEAFYHYLT